MTDSFTANPGPGPYRYLSRVYLNGLRKPTEDEPIEAGAKRFPFATTGTTGMITQRLQQHRFACAGPPLNLRGMDFHAKTTR